MSNIILASQSPRRRELLTKMGLQFEVLPSNFDERLDDARTPEEVSIELALGKAMTVARLHPESIVIGADTIVTVGGKQLGKAETEAEARQMLKLLAGQEHDVTTGLAVIKLSENIIWTAADTAKVFFRPYDEAAVSKYLETGDYKDKAAAYGIQSGAAPLVEYFVGNYDTILGLPSQLLSGFLSKMGVSSKAVSLKATVEQRLVGK